MDYNETKIRQISKHFVTARCYAKRGYATTNCLSVCLSVCLYRSVCNVQVLWSHRLEYLENNLSSNILRHLFGLTPTWAIWCNGNTPTLGWNRGVVTGHSGRQKPAISPKRCETGPRLLLRTNIGCHIRAFDWYQNRWPWATLKGVSKECPKFFTFALLSQ